MSKGQFVRLTPWGIQVAELLIQRADPLGVSLEVMGDISERLKPLHEATGRHLSDLFDEYFIVADGEVSQAKEIRVDEWPDTVRS